jgi:hypothetical protein
MPRLKSRPKNKFKRDELVVCFTTVGVPYDIAAEGVIKKGTRLRGNHPWVREFPQYFCSVDTPDDEWPNEFAGVGRPTPHEPATNIPETLPDNELVLCVQNITYGIGPGLAFEKGRRYRKSTNADAIKRHPECFEEVVSRG